MNLQQFVNEAIKQTTVSKYINESGKNSWKDGGYLGECVSLVNQYCWRVLSVPAAAWGDAKDWATNVNVAKYFDKVPDLKAGDILVYGSAFGGGKGHIEVYLGDNQSLGQNRDFSKKVIKANTLIGYVTILRVKGEHMAKVDLNAARMMAFYSGRDGRDGAVNARTGGSDEELKKNHVGKELTNEWILAWGDSSEGKKNTKRLDDIFKERDALKKRVAELEKEQGAKFEKVEVYRKIA